MTPEEKYSYVKLLSDQKLLELRDDEEIFINNSKEHKSKECYNICQEEIVRRGKIWQN